MSNRVVDGETHPLIELEFRGDFVRDWALVYASMNESRTAREIDVAIQLDAYGGTIVKLQVAVISSELCDFDTVQIKLNQVSSYMGVALYVLTV